jgi:hypothetical protein
VTETDDQQPPVSPTTDPASTEPVTTAEEQPASEVADPAEVPAEEPVVTEDTDERPGDPFEG